MSIQALDWVLQSAPEKGSDLLVLISLANHTNDSHTTEEHFSHAFQSVATIVWETRLSRATVFEVLKRLEASGRISIEHGGDGPKDTNYYSINRADPRPIRKARKSRKMAKGPDAGPSKGPDAGPSKGPDAGPSKGPDAGLKGPDAGPEPSVTSRTTSGSSPSLRTDPETNSACGIREPDTDPEGIFPSATAPTSDTTASARPRSARLRLVSDARNHGGQRPDEETDSWTAWDLALYFGEQDWGDSPDPANKKALAAAFSRWKKQGLSAPFIRVMIEAFHGWGQERPWQSPWKMFIHDRDLLVKRVREMRIYDYNDDHPSYTAEEKRQMKEAKEKEEEIAREEAIEWRAWEEECEARRLEAERMKEEQKKLDQQRHWEKLEREREEAKVSAEKRRVFEEEQKKNQAQRFCERARAERKLQSM